MDKVKLTRLTIADVLALGRRFDPKKLNKLLASKSVKKAEDSQKLLARQLKEKPLKPPKADDEYWSVDPAYLDELAARVEAGVKGE